MGIDSTIIPRFSVADETSLTMSGNTIRVKDGGITTAKLAATITDESTLTNNLTNLSIKDGGITEAKLGAHPALKPKAMIAPFSTSTSANKAFTFSAGELAAGEAIAVITSIRTSAANCYFNLTINDGSDHSIVTSALGAGSYTIQGFLGNGHQHAIGIGHAGTAVGLFNLDATEAVTMANVVSVTIYLSASGGGTIYCDGALVQRVTVV